MRFCSFLPFLIFTAAIATGSELPEAAGHYMVYKEEGALPNFLEEYPDATREQAYDFQEAFSAAFVADGDRRLGHKLGFTGAQGPPGAEAPLLGSLFVSQLAPQGEAFALSDFHNPILEVEIAFRFHHDVPMDADAGAIMAAVEDVAGCIEIPDLAYTEPEALHGLNFIAHNVLAKKLMLFDWVPISEVEDLDAIEATLTRPDGVEVAFAATEVLPDAGDHLESALVFAVEELARQGRQIRAGDVVITGCMGKALRLPKEEEAPGSHAILPGEYQVDFGPALGSYQFELAGE